MIDKDMDLLERIPETGDAARRTNLQRVIDGRVDDLVAAYEKKRSLREVATSYSGNWRDIVVFVCAVLFTIIWWNVGHSKHGNWLLMFIVMIVVVGRRRHLRRPRDLARDQNVSAQQPPPGPARPGADDLSSGRCLTARGCAQGRRRRRTPTPRCRRRAPDRGSCSPSRCVADRSRCGSPRRRVRTR